MKTFLSFGRKTGVLLLGMSLIPPAGAFDEFPIGARPAALSGAFTAVADDTYSLYYNPAGLATLTAPQMTAYYARLLPDLTDQSNTALTFLGGAGPLPKDGRWGGAGVAYTEFHMDSLYKERELRLGYGRSFLADRLSVGMNLKSLERIFGDTADTLNAIQGGLMTILEIALLFLALHYWRQGTVSIGDFVLLQAYAISLMGQLWGFGRVTRKLSESFSYSREMVEILTTVHEVRDRIGAKKLTVNGGTISFEKVSFNYNETRSVLKDFNLVIPAGQKIGIVGSSGAGKSTFVSLLLRYYDVTSGKILIDGQDVADVTQDSLRGNISLIPQDVLLFHRTLRENIRYGRTNATDAEVEAAAKLAHAADFIENVPEKYSALVGERGVRLSGGERQRVAIARAILKNAPILVLDEATSSLDSESEGLIQDSLEKLMHGKTTIVVAHRLSTLKKMDRIIVIENGHILEDGKPSELLEKSGSKFKHLWDLQVGGFIAE
jgi:ABC-type multidrug transport system fused ATPase/permease subunit